MAEEAQAEAIFDYEVLTNSSFFFLWSVCECRVCWKWKCINVWRACLSWRIGERCPIGFWGAMWHVESETRPLHLLHLQFLSSWAYLEKSQACGSHFWCKLKDFFNLEFVVRFCLKITGPKCAFWVYGLKTNFPLFKYSRWCEPKYSGPRNPKESEKTKIDHFQDKEIFKSHFLIIISYDIYNDKSLTITASYLNTRGE